MVRRIRRINDEGPASPPKLSGLGCCPSLPREMVLRQREIMGLGKVQCEAGRLWFSSDISLCKYSESVDAQRRACLPALLCSLSLAALRSVEDRAASVSVASISATDAHEP